MIPLILPATVVSILFAAPLGSPVPTFIRNRADTAPVLTPDLLTRLTTFQSLLRQEPPAISDTGVKQYRVKLVLSAETLEGRPNAMYHDLRFEDEGVDFDKLSRRYPAVAADLKRAGLNLREYRVLRETIIFLAEIIKEQSILSNDFIVRLPPKLKHDAEFLAAHMEEYGVEALIDSETL